MVKRNHKSNLILNMDKMIRQNLLVIRFVERKESALPFNAAQDGSQE